MAAYGDVLTAFPELMKVHSIYSMKARAGGGYDTRMLRATVLGIFRKVPGGKMGIQAENREENSVGTLWFIDEGQPVAQGMYLADGNDMYILQRDNGYTEEGGFREFQVGISPGITDRQVEDKTVIDGALSDF